MRHFKRLVSYGIEQTQSGDRLYVVTANIAGQAEQFAAHKLLLAKRLAYRSLAEAGDQTNTLRRRL